jgi:hypothetical protein
LNRFLGAIIPHGQGLDLAPVGQLVEYEIRAPHLVGLFKKHQWARLTLILLLHQMIMFTQP